MKLYTMGYGLLTGTHAERKRTFQDRLRAIQTRLDKKLCIIDVRKFGSGSRNGLAFYHGRPGDYGSPRLGMYDTVCSLGIDFCYIHMPIFSNTFGSTQAALKRYKEWLQAACTDKNRSDPNYYYQYFLRFVRDIRDGADCNANVLLCGCRDAYKPSGAIHCHRVVLAEELLKELGEGWEVEHLE